MVAEISRCLLCCGDANFGRVRRVFSHSFLNFSTRARQKSTKSGSFCSPFQRAFFESFGADLARFVVEILRVKAISRTAAWKYTNNGAFDSAQRDDFLFEFAL